MLLKFWLEHLMTYSAWYLILFSISYLQKIKGSRLLCLRNLIVFCFRDKLTRYWDLFVYIIHHFFTFFLRLRLIAFRSILLFIIDRLIINDSTINFIRLFIFVISSLTCGSSFLFWGLLFSFFTSHRRFSMSFILLSNKNWIDPESIIKNLDDWHIPLWWAWDFSLPITINLFWNLLLVSLWRRSLH
jgi:hypothetical protein